MEDVRLYILMRVDVPTLNAGKAVAQGSHAANQCVFEAQGYIAKHVPLDPKAVRLEQMLDAWERQTTQGFGTCIVLGVTEQQLRTRVQMAKDSGHHAGITHDPTYPTGRPPKRDLATDLLFTGVGAIIMLLVGEMWFALVFAVLLNGFWIADIVRKMQQDSLPPVIPLDTCGYIFGRKEDVQGCVVGLELMR